MATSGAGGVLVVPIVRHQGWRGEGLDVKNTLGRIWYIFTRSKQRSFS